MRLAPHSEEWYAWLAKQQEGYFYPGHHVLMRMFDEFASPQGLENRWRRSICKVVIPG